MDTKDFILESALYLFSLKGYEGTGIQEITEKSKITKPTLYYYFGSKEGLLSGIYSKYYVPFIEQLKILTIYHNDITLSLTNIVQYFFETVKDNRIFYRLNLSLIYQLKESKGYNVVKPYQNQIYDLINQMFQMAGKQHGNMKNREKEYTLSFLGIINVYIYLILNDEVMIDNNVIYKVTHQYMHGIFS